MDPNDKNDHQENQKKILNDTSKKDHWLLGDWWPYVGSHKEWKNLCLATTGQNVASIISLKSRNSGIYSTFRSNYGESFLVISRRSYRQKQTPVALAVRPRPSVFLRPAVVRRERSNEDGWGMRFIRSSRPLQRVTAVGKRSAVVYVTAISGRGAWRQQIFHWQYLQTFLRLQHGRLGLMTFFFFISSHRKMRIVVKNGVLSICLLLSYQRFNTTAQ